MTDGSAATLLAAVVTAAVAAGVFLATEVIRFVGGVRGRRDAAIEAVLASLDRILRDATKPRITMIWTYSPSVYLTATMRLFPILSKRDMIVIDWLMDHGKRLAERQNGEAIGEFVSEAQTQLMLWMRYPKIGRASMAKDLKDRGIDSSVADVMKSKPGR